MALMAPLCPGLSTFHGASGQRPSSPAVPSDSCGVAEAAKQLEILSDFVLDF